MTKTLVWEGTKAKENYNENAIIEMVEVDDYFFEKVFSEEVLNNEEYNLLKKYNFRALLRNKNTGEEKAIRTFGLPFAVFTATVV